MMKIGAEKPDNGRQVDTHGRSRPDNSERFWQDD